jgi:outer membrane receptor protein involved in Fe transport
MLALGLVGTGQSFAQDDEGLEEIVVTGSRIERSGMNTPSPVTSVSAEELSNMAPGGIIQALNQLPQFYGNSSIEDAGGFFVTPGSGNLNLRGLGTNRTLVLLNGKRVASSTRYGGTDVNLFPEALIRNVESVTGGASAAYGTDAVTGVTNFILDTEFTGFTAHTQIGTTAEGDGDNNESSITFGMDIGERGHVLFSADMYKQDGIFTYEGRGWYQGWGAVPSAAGVTPQNVIAPYVVSTGATFNGLITAPGTPLHRMEFNNAGTAISPFVECPGANTGVGGAQSAPPGSGCSGDLFGADMPTVSPDFERKSVFVYADYDVTDNLNVFFQGIHGGSNRYTTNLAGQFQFVFSPMIIYSGNAYLPPSIQQTMDDEGIASFTLNRMGHSTDLGKGGAGTEQDISLNSGTVGFEYNVDSTGFFDGWQLDGYYQKGKSDADAHQHGGTRIDRIHMAHDAVIDPGTGQIACNVTVVSGLYPDCVPLNPFGRGNMSDAAIDWVTGFDVGEHVSVSPLYFTQSGYSNGYSDDYITEAAKVIRSDIEQEVFEFNLNGQVWEGFGAGPLLGAFGYHWREEGMYQLVRAPVLPDGNVDDGRPVPANDPALGIRGQSAGDVNNSVAIQYSKVPNIEGDMDVTEYYGELLVPLLANDTIDQLNVSLAGRRADYSGSGGIWAWKWGIDAQINDQLRLRATRSHDVRAGTLSERYDQTGGAASVTDPFLANASFNIFQTSGGDPNIRPEEADTITAGIVYQPVWLEGLSVSLDWYDVSLEDAIATLTVQQVLDQCFAGDPTLCSRITRNPDGTINIIKANVLNVANSNVNGYDMEVAYNTDVDFFDWGGAESLGFRVFASLLKENSSQGFQAALVDRTGQTQGFELPELKITGSVNYRNGPMSGFFQLRWIDEGIRDTLHTEGNQIDNNTIDSALYADMNLRYEFELEQGFIEVFGNISNVFDEDPPVTPSFALFGGSSNQTNSGLFDLLGRRYTIGLRYTF